MTNLQESREKPYVPAFVLAATNNHQSDDADAIAQKIESCRLRDKVIEEFLDGSGI